MAEFKVNDRVTLSHEGSGGDGAIDGTVVKVEYDYLHIMRDDSYAGSGINDSWLCLHRHASLISRSSVLIACDAEAVEADKRGYRPDGFNPEAHRSFMKDLGGGS